MCSRPEPHSTRRTGAQLLQVERVRGEGGLGCRGARAGSDARGAGAACSLPSSSRLLRPASFACVTYLWVKVIVKSRSGLKMLKKSFHLQLASVPGAPTPERPCPSEPLRRQQTVPAP